MSLATINEYEKKPSNGLVNGGIKDLLYAVALTGSIVDL